MSCYFNETWKYDPALDCVDSAVADPRYWLLPELCATVLGDTVWRAGLLLSVQQSRAD